MPEVTFTGPAGRIEGRFQPSKVRGAPIAIVLHPHPQFGGTMNNKIVYDLFYSFVQRGFSALRFNFRGVGRSVGTFDAGPGEKEDFKAAVDFVSERFPDAPIWAAGMSFGSWIAMTVGAQDSRVSLLLGIAPPVDRYDFDALRTCTLPKFIIHGEEDELISIKEIRKFYSQIPEPKELVTIEYANHLFEGKTPLVAEAVEDLLADFNTVRT